MANHLIDLVGRKFGRLTVIARVPAPTRPRWSCRCDCGQTTEAAGGNLQSGNVSSCGCYRREQKQAQMAALGGRNAANLVGRRFGKLTVLRRATQAERIGSIRAVWDTAKRVTTSDVNDLFMVTQKNPKSRSYWVCRCACGNNAVKMGKYLLNGDTASCGCDRGAKPTHGGISKGVKQREYGIWRAMKSRCHTPSSSGYRFYGARGVTVCDRWRNDYAAFRADMGRCPPGLTIDRIDPSGNYEPANCRWATWEVQHQNLRSSKQHRGSRQRLP